MSSHREAPEISKDPSADNTDVYAFVSPDRPRSVTLIANFIPFELPYGGPNFNEFDESVVYEIIVSNRGDSLADIIYRFEFSTVVRNPKTFLYNVGPIASPKDANLNRYQTYTLSRIDRVPGGASKTHMIGRGMFTAPANVGVRSTPDYPSIATKAVYDVGLGRKVFAGPRADGFHVDLGSIFDLGDLRPFQEAFNKDIPPPLANMPGVNGLRGLNVHTIALQVPAYQLTSNRKTPIKSTDKHAVIGVWARATRAKMRVFDNNTNTYKNMGAMHQVSRLGNPLFNEVINPMGVKDEWNASLPNNDSEYANFVLHPELAQLISKVLYPSAFPNLAKYTKPRNDLAAILLTGIPAGVVSDTFTTYTGPVQADMLRLNMAIPATEPGSNGESQFGVLGNDVAGFPNGRRVFDDVTAIELKAIAGATIPLVDKSYKPDGAAAQLNDGTLNDNNPYGPNDSRDNNGQPVSKHGAAFLPNFPYLNHPNNGYNSRPGMTGDSTPPK